MYFMGEMALRSGSLEEGGFAFTWEWSNFPQALEGRGGQIARTFLYSAVATLVALLVAYPLAYAIATRSRRWKIVLLFAVIAPFLTTYLIRTIAWKTILADSSPIVDVLQTLALIPDDGRVLATSGAVIAGLTYNFLPFMILPIYASIERLDFGLVEAAKDLYASARQAFLRVTLPLTAPGIVAGVLLTFIPAFGDYVNAAILGGTNTAMIGNKIQSLYLVERDYPEAAALSFLMMAAVLALVLVYIRLAGTDALMGAEDERGWTMGAAARAAARAPAAGRSWLRRNALNIYTALALAYMLIPIAVIAVFSFGDTPKDRLTFIFDGFTLEYWERAFSVPGLNEALVTSLQLAALATVASTAIGTLMALALVRYRIRGRRTANLLLVLPLASPEIVIGAALLSMFIFYAIPLGFTTLLIAHIMFSISFVVVVVRSRLIGFDRNLEEAAADLGASPPATFRTVTLPLLAPGIVAAAMLAFALSIDDFVISNFNSGTTVTFPLYVFGVALRGIPVQVNVLATMLFVLTSAAIALVIWQQRRAERLAGRRLGQEEAAPLGGVSGPAAPGAAGP